MVIAGIPRRAAIRDFAFRCIDYQSQVLS